MAKMTLAQMWEYLKSSPFYCELQQSGHVWKVYDGRNGKPLAVNGKKNDAIRMAYAAITTPQTEPAAPVAEIVVPDVLAEKNARIAELEAEVAEKNARIAAQGDTIESMQMDVYRLEAEVESLKVNVWQAQKVLKSKLEDAEDTVLHTDSGYAYSVAQSKKFALLEVLKIIDGIVPQAPALEVHNPFKNASGQG